MYSFLVAVAVICLNFSSFSEGVSEFYFSAPNGEPCPKDIQCHNLSGYGNFNSNSVYYFLQGNHVINVNSFMIISSVENITFQGIGITKTGNHSTIMESSAVVNCSNSQSGFLFYKSVNVFVRNITIIGCGGSLGSEILVSLTRTMRNRARSDANRFMRYRMAFVVIETRNIVFEHTSIQRSSDYGLLAVNAYNATITHCSFAYNNIENYGRTCLSRRNCFGGNALLAYTRPLECNPNFEIYNTEISYSNFSFGFDSNVFSRFTGSGLAIYLEQADAFGIHHLIKNVILHGNSGVLGANFRYTVTGNVIEHTLTLSSVISEFANEYYTMNELSPRTYGAGMYINVGTRGRRNTIGRDDCYNGSVTPIQHRTTFIMSDCVSSNNRGAYGTGLYLVCDVTVENQYGAMENCDFKNNSGFAGAGILLVQENNLNYRYQLKNITVADSRQYIPPNFGAVNIASAIMIRRLHNISFFDLQVTNNPFTGLFLLNTQATFLGDNVLFSNNTALYGGGLQVHGDSGIILQAPVVITFQSNTAIRAGGAIFVSPSPYITVPCFFQPYDMLEATEMKPMSIILQDNDAIMGGDVLYGANIDSCYLTMASRFYNPSTQRGNVSFAQDAFNEVFMIEEELSRSSISSDPDYVCFCVNGLPDCPNRNTSIRTYPGGESTFAIVAVGVRHGTAPGIINMEELKNGDTLLKADVMSSNVNCTNVSYFAPGREDMDVKVNYFINQVNIANNLSIHVEILNCSTGFELSNGKCDCNSDIMNLNENVTCDQSTGTFSHKGGIWIGYDNDTDCFITSSSCQLGYCSNEPVSFQIDTQDRQCRHSRSGIQCGKCADGHSLMLGTNECGECSNNYLTLLIVFAFAGIALVLFILSLNMTVSFGTINGLIFYANIVKINEAYLFPQGLVRPLQIFISWLNLDFGIPTCFATSLDANSRTALQLVFPFYLWGVTIFIAIMIHFSSRLTKLMGRKIVPVMATLLLLSFTKLLRACIVVWQFGYYTCNGSVRRVWAIDPNVMYWSVQHGTMVAVTGLIFIFLIVPYTLTLLFSPLIERYLAQFKLLGWWIKMKPFVDAYDGPYRDKYRYWTGLLLLVRVVLVPVFATQPVVGIRLTVIFSALLLSIMAFTSGLYRHKGLDGLEIWFILQLIFISSQTTDTNIMAYISVIMVMITVVGIIIFHILYQLNLIDRIKSWILMKWENRSEVTLTRNFSAYTHDLLTSVQKPRNITSVRVNQNAKYLEDGAWVVNKRETLLKDYK